MSSTPHLLTSLRDARLPNFFLVGAMRAGTTSTYFYLRDHPQIYVSQIKEPNFFAADLLQLAGRPTNVVVRHGRDSITHFAFIRGSTEYQQLFAGVSDQLAIGECSVSYLFSRTAAKAIAAMVPDARIVMILRDPVERAFSHYLLYLHDGRTSLSLRRELKHEWPFLTGEDLHHVFIECSLYYRQVERYLEAFPSSQVKIFLYEDLRNREAFLENLYSFLDVNPSFRPAQAWHLNRSTMPRAVVLNKFRIIQRARSLLSKGLPSRLRNAVERVYSSKTLPKLGADDRAYLKTVFRSDIEKLQLLINRDLDAWLQ